MDHGKKKKERDKHTLLVVWEEGSGGQRLRWGMGMTGRSGDERAMSIPGRTGKEIRFNSCLGEEKRTIGGAQDASGSRFVGSQSGLRK